MIEELIQLPLTKSEYHYAQHCIAFYEAIQEGDVKTSVTIIALLKQNDLYHQPELRTALAHKMNKISFVAFKDSDFLRRG